MISVLFLAAAAPAWHFAEQVDPITDKSYATATLTGEAGSVVLKCGPQSEGNLYVGVTSRKVYLGGYSEPVVVSFRFDEGAPISSPSWIMEDRYAYSFKLKDIYAFIENLPRSKKVVVQMYSYTKEQVNVSVDIPEDNTAIWKVMQKCKLLPKVL